jgi:tetratricopeptide (TPR) repeat protein
MVNPPTSQELELAADQGQTAFQSGDFETAARLFGEAGMLCEKAGDPLRAAELANNRSVALLKAGDPNSAWHASKGTDQIFAAAGDLRRQGLALGNQASALEALGRLKEAEDHYSQAADLLKTAGEQELRGITLQSLSALQLRRKNQFVALATIQSALASKQKLTPSESLLKRLIRLVFQLLNR